MSVKVSDQSRVRPVMTLSGFLGGSVESGPSGQVPTANGSNQVAWGSNVAIITSNGSNALLGPYVNFSAGSNILFTLDQGPLPGQAYPSNTLRIHVHPDISALTAFIGAKAYATTTQTVLQNVSTAVVFDSEEFDTNGFHSTSVTTSRFTIPPGLAGKYLVTAGGRTPNTGDPYLDLIVNGSTYVRGGRAGGPIGRHGSNLSAIVALAVGDYIEVHCFQQATASISIGDSGGNRQNEMAMTIQYLGT